MSRPAAWRRNALRKEAVHPGITSYHFKKLLSCPNPKNVNIICNMKLFQNFGVLELFEGGQHRQHAAMMVMAMFVTH